MKSIAFFLFFVCVEAFAQKPIIRLETTPCRGYCPVQQIEIFPNRTITFHGEAHTEKLGHFTSKLSKKEYNRLLSAFRRANFFAMKDSYTERVADLPTTYITYREGERTKKIMDYYNAPDALKALETRVLAFVKTKNWKAISGDSK